MTAGDSVASIQARHQQQKKRIAAQLEAARKRARQTAGREQETTPTPEEGTPHDRHGELRKAVQTQAEASARQAKLEIDRRSVGLQEQIMVGGFESDEARRFLESLPSAEALMPSLELPALGT